MRPDKITVYDLFDRQRRYEVPLYQRQYVWTKDAQWAPLWEDLADKAHLVLQGTARAPHFLGAIVTSQRQVFGDQINAWEIIDGQQRLTTLQVVLTAFADVLRGMGETRYERDMQRITRNEGVMRDEGEKFKVWPTNSDRQVFRTVMEAGGLEALLPKYPGLRGRKKRHTPSLTEAYAFFFRQIQQFILSDEDEPGFDGAARANALFETFRKYLQIVNIELEADDDPQVIFESLNGRGVPLLPSDLVRNFVFMRASRGPIPLDGLYGRFWKTYDEWRRPGDEEAKPWWKQEERQGRNRRPRIDLFLHQYLQYRTEQEINIGHLFQEFRSWWDADPDREPAGTLGDVQRHAEAFVRWIQPEGKTPEAEFARTLKALDTSTVYPLMFFLLAEPEALADSKDIGGIVQDLESFLVRRAVCGLTIKQYNRYFIAALRNLRKSAPVSREAVRAVLSAGTGDSVRWPDDEEFGRAFVHRPVYRALKRDVAHAVLLALEKGLATPRHEQIEIQGKLSIEHIMPQAWQDWWEISDDSDEGRERRERLLHAFGNLTLVTQQFNTSLSNRAFDRKQKELRRITRLLLNQPLLDHRNWDEGAIVDRGRALFDIARKRWPHPQSPSSLAELHLDFDSQSTWKIRLGADDEPEQPPIDLPSAATLLDEFVALPQANQS